MALTPGDRFGPYVVVGPIGAGGMGEVYRARDSRLGREVALKVLSDAVRLQPGRLARFEREARALASLNHPGIAAIYGVEEGLVDDSGRPLKALVLELVEGGTLATRIARGPVPIPESLAIARQICEALEAAHSKGVVHRDLKPGNVALTPDGTVKVLDFGLAKISSDTPNLDETQTTGATREGTVMGTAAYMSPEQATGQVVDKRTDIWAFACVLFEMLTGRRAFDGGDVTRILGAVLKSDPDWTTLPAGTPSSIRRMLRRALTKDSRQRLGDIRDARIEIDEAGTESEGAVPSASARGRRPVRLAALAFMGALIAVLAIPAMRHVRETLPEEMRPEISTPPTLDPLQFALSPDGRHVVFVVSGDGPTLLWRRDLDSTAEPIPGTEGAYLPFWSADSQSIGFFARGKLYRLDINGGPPQPLANASAGRGGTWNADGTILFAPNNQGLIMRMPASGGEPTVVMPADRRRGNGDRSPQFLPDGRNFLFYVTGGSETSGIYLASLDGGEPSHLAAADSAGTYLRPDSIVFVRRGTLLAQRLDLARRKLTGNPITIAESVGYDASLNLGGVSISADGRIAYRTGKRRVQLTWFDRAGNHVGTAGQPDNSGLQFPDLSPDERFVAIYRELENSQDIWLLDLARDGLNRFTRDAANDINPAFSRRSERIAFTSNRKGTYDIYVQPLNGGEAQLVVTTENTKVPQDWSKDDRYLLFYEATKTGRDLWAQDITQKGSRPIVVANTPYEETTAQFSPDGRWVAYQTDESGRFEIVVQSFPEPGTQLRVSTDGGVAPRWRSDSKEIYFIAPDRKMMAAAVEVNGSRVAVKKAAPLFPTRIEGGGSAGINKPNYAVSSDGRFLVNQLVEEPSVPITLLLNWKR